MIEKNKAVGKPQLLKGDSRGLVASVFDTCIQGIKEMPEDATADCCVKTADEMFRELGYTKVPAPSIVYIRNEGECEERIIITPTVCGVFMECLVDGETQGVTKEEILACAQLIKEMEK